MIKIEIEFGEAMHKGMDHVVSGRKKSKEEVNYRHPLEHQGKKMCSECRYYLYPHQLESPCSKVAGIVNGNYVCDLFAGS